MRDARHGKGGDQVATDGRTDGRTDVPPTEGAERLTRRQERARIHNLQPEEKRARFLVGRAKTSRALRGRPHTPEHCAAMSAALRGRKTSPETRARISEAQRGKKLTVEHRAKISANSGTLSGPACHFWRGGISAQDRGGNQYSHWKRRVHRRDNNTCLRCQKPWLQGRDRIADHIVRWIDAPELRFSVDNGRTLCRSCHLWITGEQQHEAMARKRAAA